MPGALYQNISGIGEVYTLPCDVELNVTFKFGGVEYPVHPLDTSISTLKKKDALGNTFCIGSFQPIISTAQASTYDMILGMSFCEYPFAASIPHSPLALFTLFRTFADEIYE